MRQTIWQIFFHYQSKNHDFFDKNINNPAKIKSVKEAIESANRRLNERVIDSIRQFKGYSHVMVIGGGSDLISQAIKDFCDVRQDRFLFPLIHNLIWSMAFSLWGKYRWNGKDYPLH